MTDLTNSSSLILPSDDTNVIDPVVRHIMSEGEAGPIIARACYVFQLCGWRQRRRDAEARNDFAALDALDRAYELIGLP